MRALAIIAVLVAAGVARADEFETKAAGAQHIQRIESLVWALTAPCDGGDDIAQRQCRHVRDGRLAELAGQTLLVDADADAFEVGDWSPQKRSVALTLSACIRCLGVEVDGKNWYVVGSTAAGGPPRFEGGRLKVATLHENARTFPDEAAAKAWIRTVSNVHVQLLLKIPAKPKWSEQTKVGVVLEVQGYRVFTPCDGAIVIASPASGAALADKKQCGPVVAGAPDDTKTPDVETLTAAMIETAMKPVVDAAHECYGHFAVTGKAKLKITVLGDGTIGKYEQQGDFTSTNTGACIDRAMTKAKFPHVKKAKTTIIFPITLNAP